MHMTNSIGGYIVKTDRVHDTGQHMTLVTRNGSFCTMRVTNNPDEAMNNHAVLCAYARGNDAAATKLEDSISIIWDMG